MRKFLRQPKLWLGAFGIWFGTLWWLSSRAHHLPEPMTFQFSDKILHFGYFFGGGILLSAFLYLRTALEERKRKVVAITVLICGLVGALDEFHQTFIPGRSGNDFADFAADIIGSLCGGICGPFIADLLHRKDLKLPR